MSVVNEVPAFRYHPNPLATGSLEPSDAVCEVCDASRGYTYTGPVFAIAEVESLCPWCIADGSAARRFNAVFTDVEGPLPGVPPKVIDEVCRRTLGFSGWQQETWLFHCADGAAFLGRADWEQIKDHPTAVDMLLKDGWHADALPDISSQGELTAYLFQCLHCKALLAYADAT